MNGLARVVLVGNLGADPDEFSAGCRFSVAVNERVKKDGEWAEAVSFFDVTAFGKLAEPIVKWLKKGSPVAVDGRLRQERWTDKNDQKRYSVKVIADSVQFLPDGEKRGGGGGSAGAGGSADATGNTDDDDIPFARPRIPDRETRRRDLFVGDRRWVV
jgi:single-strand DNA-binding protein